MMPYAYTLHDLQAHFDTEAAHLRIRSLRFTNPTRAKGRTVRPCHSNGEKSVSLTGNAGFDQPGGRWWVKPAQLSDEPSLIVGALLTGLPFALAPFAILILEAIR